MAQATQDELAAWQRKEARAAEFAERLDRIEALIVQLHDTDKRLIRLCEALAEVLKPAGASDASD
jgi:hypothetical protein